MLGAHIRKEVTTMYLEPMSPRFTIVALSRISFAYRLPVEAAL